MLLNTILYACVEGAEYTVPLTAIFTVVAPVDARVIFPEGVPVAEVAMRTYIVVLATVPPLCVKVRLLVKPEPDDREISNPVGAVRIMSSDNSDPEAVKFCEADAEPDAAVKAESVPLVEIVGPATTV